MKRDPQSRKSARARLRCLFCKRLAPTIGLATVLSIFAPLGAYAGVYCIAGSQEQFPTGGSCSANQSFGGIVATSVGLYDPPPAGPGVAYYDVYEAVSQTSSGGYGSGHAFAAATAEYNEGSPGEETGSVGYFVYLTSSATATSGDIMTLKPKYYGENVTVQFTSALSASVSLSSTAEFYGEATSDSVASACVEVGGQVCAAKAISDAANPAADVLVGRETMTFSTNGEGVAIVPFSETTAADVFLYAGYDLDNELIQENDGVADASETANFYIKVLTPDVTVSFASGHDYGMPASSIPEPSTWAMLIVGFGGLGYAGWRQRRARRAVI
jgi:hypothetical protein